MSTYQAKTAFQNSVASGDAARLHIRELRKKPDADQGELEILDDLALAIRELASGLKEMANQVMD